MTPEKAKEILKLLAEENVIISEERQQKVLDCMSYRTAKHNEQHRARKRKRMEDPEYRAKINAYQRAWAQRKKKEKKENE